jgi:hypothetical protein
MEKVNPGPIASEAIKGGAIAAGLVLGWNLLKKYAPVVAGTLTAAVPEILPAFVVGAVAFGVLKLAGQLFPAAK